MTFRVQPAIVTRICDGCRAESDPVDLPVLREQGWTLAPGGPYDHPVPALDWCPNCTAIRSDLAAAIQRVGEVPKKVAVARKCDVDNPQKFAWYQGWNDAIDAVFRALDGDA